jgi:hypothetical protein
MSTALRPSSVPRSGTLYIPAPLGGGSFRRYAAVEFFFGFLGGFMSVLKNKRGLSKLEFYHNARKLRRDITALLLRDFGVRDKIRTLKTPEGAEVTVIEGYPDWLIEKFRDSIMDILRRLMLNITAGNTIYPTNEAELQQRRQYQTAAIVNCEQLLQEMHYCEDVLPVHISKFLPYVVTIRLDTSGRTLLAWQAYCVQPVSCPVTLCGIRGKRGHGEELPLDAAQGFFEKYAQGI